MLARRVYKRDTRGRFARNAGTKVSSAPLSQSNHGDGIGAEAKLPGAGFGSTTIGVRANTRSVSTSVGKTFPIIPGRLNGYIGILGRLERAGAEKTFIEKAVDRKVAKGVGSIKNPETRKLVGDLVSGKAGANVAGTRVQLSGPKISRGQISATRRLDAAGHVIQPGRKPRAPRRPRLSPEEVAGIVRQTPTPRKRVARKRKPRAIAPGGVRRVG